MNWWLLKMILPAIHYCLISFENWTAKQNLINSFVWCQRRYVGPDKVSLSYYRIDWRPYYNKSTCNNFRSGKEFEVSFHTRLRLVFFLLFKLKKRSDSFWLNRPCKSLQWKWIFIFFSTIKLFWIFNTMWWMGITDVYLCLGKGKLRKEKNARN